MNKLQILARAEIALAKIKAQRTGFQAALFAVAALFALFGLALLNAAGYQALVPRMGPAIAALVVAVTNMALAALAVIIAVNAKPGRENEKMAQEIRDMASEEIKKDVDEVRGEVSRIGDEIEGIRTGISSVRGAVPSGWKSVVGIAKSVRKKSDESD